MGKVPRQPRWSSETETDTKNSFGGDSLLYYTSNAHTVVPHAVLSLSSVMYCGNKAFAGCLFLNTQFPSFNSHRSVRIGLGQLLNNVPFVLCFPVSLYLGNLPTKPITGQPVTHDWNQLGMFCLHSAEYHNLFASALR